MEAGELAEGVVEADFAGSGAGLGAELHPKMATAAATKARGAMSFRFGCIVIAISSSLSAEDSD